MAPGRLSLRFACTSLPRPDVEGLVCACSLRPTQAHVRNPGLSLSAEEILQLASSLQPADASQEPESYNPEWPNSSKTPEMQSGAGGLDSPEMRLEAIHANGALPTTANREDIKPSKAAH